MQDPDLLRISINEHLEPISFGKLKIVSSSFILWHFLPSNEKNNWNFWNVYSSREAHNLNFNKENLILTWHLPVRNISYWETKELPQK